MADHTKKDPQPTKETEGFWNATREGKFVVRSCSDCSKAHWYPRSRCPFCASDNTHWVEASGTGTIYSYSVMRRADPVYVMAYVTLAEGPTMMTNLIDCDPNALTIGDAVTLSFLPTPGGYNLPMFTTSTGENG